jgi:hypothetical protein
MRSQPAVRLGVVEPQVVHLPPDVHSLAAAEEAIELADAYGVAGGFPLDDSQRFTLRAALGERVDGSWAAATVCDFEPRQNGKNDTCAARELAGLVLFGEQLILHTAHEFKTANESFLRMVAVFEAWDDLRKKVARIRFANGEQGVEFLSGQRLKYLARSGGSGRGFAKMDLVVYDEAQHLQQEHVAASGPARLANPNAQSWYLGSGGLASSVNAWRMRRRALAGGGGRFAYVEHTAELVRFEGGRVVSERPDVLDRDAWARANAAYGRRISDESFLTLYDELGPDLFARECLCLWDAEVGSEDRVIPADVWEACCSETVTPDGRLTLGIDVSEDRAYGAIVVSDVAGRVELIESRSSPALWLVDRVVEVAGRHRASVAFDPGGPAGSYGREIEALAISLAEVGPRELSQACGAFYDDAMAGRLQVRRHPRLSAAVAGAEKRSVGDAWRWDRRHAKADVSPLMAATIARWVATHAVKDLQFAF